MSELPAGRYDSAALSGETATGFNQLVKRAGPALAA
jgi:hypothetical protein